MVHFLLRTMVCCGMTSSSARCIEAGMPPKVLQTLLGHTDISITLNTYCNAFDQFQAEGLAKFADYMEQQGLLL